MRPGDLVQAVVAEYAGTRFRVRAVRRETAVLWDEQRKELRLPVKHLRVIEGPPCGSCAWFKSVVSNGYGTCSLRVFINVRHQDRVAPRVCTAWKLSPAGRKG